MTIHQHRRIVPHICPVCGSGYEGLATKRTCSDACRQEKHRRKKQKPA